LSNAVRRFVKSGRGKIFAFLQKLLNPFPQIYDKPFSADVGTSLHDGATIHRSTSGSRVVVASTVESAAFSVSFADFSLRALVFAANVESRKKRETSVCRRVAQRRDTDDF